MIIEKHFNENYSLLGTMLPEAETFCAIYEIN